MPSMDKMCKNNTKNILISLMVVVKDLKVLYGSGAEEVKQKLPFLLLSLLFMIRHCSVA